MDSEGWYKFKAILADVQELDSSSRQAFLDTAPISEATRRKIESFLLREDTGHQFLSLPASGFADEFFPEEKGSNAVRQIGVYDIVREIGIGGMGAVYLAERRDGKFDQQVAIKLLKREFNAGHMRRSFDREIEILSKLSHPSIARMLDTDLTDDGIPYIVMEYVDGVPIDRYCRERKLSLRDRLKLFNKACEAVSFAHQHLIVHRDLKPSNILVTPDGVVKLLDFGISKLLDGTENDAGFTMQAAMTPEYASPEQVKGQNVTTLTDIYSLGIVLYKMLTGSHPFGRSEQSNNELFRAITDAEPTLPSEASLSAVAGQGGVPGMRLRGDLDNIILKAIRKDPNRRYRSVEQFSTDIWRYIDGKPIEARPATRAYRLRKFYKRNKVAVTLGVMIFATLIAGVAVSAWQTGVARANAAAAIMESDNAKAEQKKAEKVSNFMMKIIRYANPNWYAEGYKFKGEARVIQALDDLASKMDTEFPDQPDVLAELHHHFGDAYNARGEPGGKEKARSHFERAFELRRLHYGNWHELVAKDMVYLYWTRPNPTVTTDEDVQLLADAIVMMRSTNPKNLNLPFMLEDYLHKLSNDKYAELHDMYLRHIPQPAPNNKYLAADQLLDEMIGLLRLHYAEDSNPVVNQKCVGMALKRRVNKIEEAETFFQACANGNAQIMASTGKPSAKFQKLLEDYERARGLND